VSVGLYMDVHVPRAITEALRLRGVDVLTAQDDGAARLPDSELLDRASALGRVLFTRDGGLLRVTIGQCVRDLETIARFGEPENFRDRVEYLPLR